MDYELLEMEVNERINLNSIENKYLLLLVLIETQDPKEFAFAYRMITGQNPTGKETVHANAIVNDLSDFQYRVNRKRGYIHKPKNTMKK